MNQLSHLCDLKCAPCRGGIPPLSREHVAPLSAQVPEWTVAEDARSISREWRFKDFKESLAFVNEVGNLAEAEGHHPDFEFGWGYVRLKLWTHAIKGLHQNDFILAAKIDRLLA